MYKRRFPIGLFLLTFFALLFLLPACKNPASSPPPREPGRWLILVHFAVDNNIDYEFETEHGFISNYLETLEDLEARDAGDVLDIVVLMDGYTGTVDGELYTSPFRDGYYHLTGGAFADDLEESIVEVNSGGVGDSTAFIDWAWENRPADYVVYSVFNHGGGFDDANTGGTYGDLSYGAGGASPRGIGFDDDGDEEEGSGDCLSHRELAVLTAYIKSKTGRNVDLFFP